MPGGVRQQQRCTSLYVNLQETACAMSFVTGNMGPLNTQQWRIRQKLEAIIGLISLTFMLSLIVALSWYFHGSVADRIIFPPQTGQPPWLLRSCSATLKRICIPMESRFFLVFLQRNNRAYQYAQPEKTDKIIKQSGIGCNNFLSVMKLPMAQTGNYLHVVLTGSHLFRAEHCILKRSRKEEHQLHSDRFAQLFRKPEELDLRC